MLPELNREWSDLSYQVDPSEVRRYLGFRPGQTQEQSQVESLLTEMMALGQELVEPIGIGAMFPVDLKPQGLQIGPDLLIAGPRTRKRLGKITWAYLFAVTIGPKLEETAASFFSQGEYTKGVILDSIGSSAVESLAKEVNRRVVEGAKQVGLTAQERISPGYSDWPLEDQYQLCSLIGTTAIGLRLSAAAMLQPRKSITALIGLSTEATGDYATVLGCSDCDSVECQFRS